MEEKEQVKPRRITKKQYGFIRDYLATGSGVQAVLKNYNVSSYNTAKALASENIAKPYIRKAIDDALSDDKLKKAHEELLNQAKFEYFTFPKKMSDEEIEEKVNAVGVSLVVIQEGEKGKYAFYKTIDSQARKAALDMAYKLKGSYAPDKNVNLNIDVPTTKDVKELTQKLNDLHRGTSSASDGRASGIVGEEVRDQE